MQLSTQASVDPALAAEIESIYRLYAALAEAMDPEAGLGGKLLYAAEPDQAGSRLLRAANIAGAASLAASADPSLLRGAMRAGALDFVVTSLDEALRILKNEIRKRQPVAVGVSVAQEALLAEMLERGVQPDLLTSFAPVLPGFDALRTRGARLVEPRLPAPGCALHLYRIPHEWKQPASAFDELLLDCLAPADHVNRRWLRLAARYLPAAARRVRPVVGDEAMCARLGAAVSASAAS